MKHPVDAEEIMALVDGEPNPAAQSHLETCGECQVAADDFRNLSQALRTWQIEPATVELDTSGIGAPPRWKVWLRSSHAWQFSIAGATACALLIFWPRSQTAVAPVRTQLPDSFSLMEPAPVAQRLQAEKEPVPDLSRMVIRAAEMEITTSDLARARRTLDAALQRFHGYISSLNTRTPENSGRVIETTLRVPADRLDEFLAELRKLGRVLQESQNGSEIRQQYVDLEARLSNARNTERRLTDLELRESGRLSDVLAIEKEIDRVRGQIEQMEAERKGIAAQVAMATVHATIIEPYKASLIVLPTSVSARFHNAAVNGYSSVVNGVVGFAEFILSWGPSILLWTAILFWPARMLKKRFDAR